jgi:hypothetical protein
MVYISIKNCNARHRKHLQVSKERAYVEMITRISMRDVEITIQRPANQRYNNRSIPNYYCYIKAKSRPNALAGSNPRLD